MVNQRLSIVHYNNVKSCAKNESEDVGRLSSTCGVCLYRAVHSTTNLCPIEVVYGLNGILPLQEQVNLDATMRSEFIKKIHEETRRNIEKKFARYGKHANKSKKRSSFSLETLCGCTYIRIVFPTTEKQVVPSRRWSFQGT
jgi:hypothetical protein